MITLTADAFEEDFRRAKAAGMNGYLTKPVDAGRLCAALSDAFQTPCPKERG